MGFRRGVVTLLGASVLAMATVGSMALPASAASGTRVDRYLPTNPSFEAQRGQVLSAINAERARVGAPPLRYNLRIEGIADATAVRSSQAGEYAGTPDMGKVMSAAGCNFWSETGFTWSSPEPLPVSESDGKFFVENISDNSYIYNQLIDPKYTDLALGARSAQGYFPSQINPAWVRNYQVAWGLSLGTCKNPQVLPVSDTPNYGGHAVKGALLDGYRARGAERSFLGLPVANEFGPLKNGGYGQHFQGGSLYWSQASGTQSLGGSFRSLYSAMGWENSYLGYPTSSEQQVRGGVIQRFQGGLMYWSAATGAQSIRGSILNKYGAYGYEAGRLGFPTTSEIGLRGGAFTAFQGGSIYWSQATGARAVFGAIKDAWGASGWEVGYLGYPSSDEFGALRDGGYGQHFQGGSLYWSPATGAHSVRGALRDAWSKAGWEGGSLGYPKTNEYSVPGGLRQDFQGGSLLWNGRETVRL